MSETASPKDFAHFAAIGLVEAEAEAERIDRALKTPPGDRMIQGIKMGAVMRWTTAILAEINAPNDEQMELARHQIARGLTLLTHSILASATFDAPDATSLMALASTVAMIAPPARSATATVNASTAIAEPAPIAPRS